MAKDTVGMAKLCSEKTIAWGGDGDQDSARFVLSDMAT